MPWVLLFKGVGCRVWGLDVLGSIVFRFQGEELWGLGIRDQAWVQLLGSPVGP